MTRTINTTYFSRAKRYKIIKRCKRCGVRIEVASMSRELCGSCGPPKNNKDMVRIVDPIIKRLPIIEI